MHFLYRVRNIQVAKKSGTVSSIREGWKLQFVGGEKSGAVSGTREGRGHPLEPSNTVPIRFVSSTQPRTTTKYQRG